MDRRMRRFKQQLAHDECIRLLSTTTCGVLALCGSDGEPYGVPLSHVYSDGSLYFHSALTGLKLELIRQNPNASYTVIAQDEIHPERYTIYFRSVIAFGRVRIIESPQQKRRCLELLGLRCNSDDPEGLAAEIESGIARCLVLELPISRLTGKQAIELMASKD